MLQALGFARSYRQTRKVNMKDKNEKRISIRLTEGQNVRLLEAAIRKGLTIASYMRMASLESARKDEEGEAS